MDRKLSRLFDFQKFENNPRLAALIEESENRYCSKLSDEDLFFVSAAGQPELSGDEKDFQMPK